MHRERSVLIIGAGASAEFNMPVGADLRDDIIKALDINLLAYPDTYDTNRIPSAIQTIAAAQKRQDSSYQGACNQIVTGMSGAASIDAYIDTRPDDPDIAACGKIAIVDSILRREPGSYLQVTNKKNEYADTKKVESTWAMKLAQMIFDGCSKDNLKKRLDKITFVVFNYDRCLQRFFYLYLILQYGLSDTLAADVINSMKFYHPYGKVGDLEWEEGPQKVPFGGAPPGNKIAELSANIKTYTEQNVAQTPVTDIHAAISGANRILFLGFAYHPQNMQILTTNERNQNSIIYGTAFKESGPSIELIRNEIALGVGGRDVARIERGLKCRELFDFYYHEFIRG